MKKCFDAGTIQAFLDGELATDANDAVARHVADCDACARLLSEAEEETAFAFTALEREFGGAAALVPTVRLWTKINDSIESSERENGKSTWKSAFASFKSLFANPSIAAFAGLLIVAGIFFFVRNFENGENKNYIARENESKKEIVAPKQNDDKPGILDESETTPPPKIIEAKTTLPKAKTNDSRFVKANFAAKEIKRPHDSEPFVKRDLVAQTVAPEFISGEETYIKTLAALERTVNSRKDEVLKPSARFSFEKDLAVADDAIAKMKTEVKQNPKNAAAKQVLLASYQNKVDLLNSVAEKTELMASLK